MDLVSEDGDMGMFPAMVAVRGVLSNRLQDVDSACPCYVHPLKFLRNRSLMKVMAGSQ